MTDLENGNPQGQLPEKQPAPQEGDPGGQAAQPDDFGGDYEKAVTAYRNLHSKFGEHTNELGELRKVAAWVEANIVPDPDDPNTYWTKPTFEKEKAKQTRQQPQPQAQPQNQFAQPPQLTREQIEEKLALMPESEKLQLIIQAASAQSLQTQAQRERAYSGELVAKNPDIRQKAYEYEMQGFAPDMAVRLAIGDKVQSTAANFNLQPPPAVTPQMLANLHNADRTFMQPQGTIPVEGAAPKSNLTPDQIRVGETFGYSAKDLEPFATRRQ